MILILALLMLFCGGVANAQIVSPIKAPPAAPVTSSLPSGAPPQVIGYSAANTAESETVGGDFTFARTGPNAYTATITKLNGTPVGALATLNVGTGLTATTTLSLTSPVAVTLGGTGTTAPPSAAGQLLISQSASAYGAVAMTGDGSINSAGALTVTKLAGTTPGGVCSAGAFVSTISASGVPTCTTPSTAGVPSGTAPQIVGYTAVGAPESETVSGGAGGCSFTRTGANAYQMVCTTYAPTASPTFTGTVTIPTLTLTSGTVSTGLTMNAGSTFQGPDGGIWTNSGINDGTIKATTQFTFPDNATWTTAGLNNGTHFGIGQAATTLPLDITGNQNAITEIRVTNNNTGTFAQAGISFSNGSTNANVGISSTGYTGGGSTGSMRPNALFVQSGLAGGISIGNDVIAPIYFSIGGTTVGQFTSAAGLSLPIPLAPSNGGTGSAATPSVGQVLVATSGTVYTPTFLGANNITGVTDGSNATAGAVGEFLTNSVVNVAGTFPATATNQTSVNLGAGDWQVWGTYHLVANGSGIACNAVHIALNTVSATFPTTAGQSGDFQIGATATLCGGASSCLWDWPVGPMRISSASAVTAYLVAQAGCTGTWSGPTYSAFIYARRMR